MEVKQTIDNDIFFNELVNKAIKGSFWIAFLKCLDLILSLSRTIILVRLLLPKDFGLIGLVWSIFFLLEAFTQSGYERALIQKNENIEKYLDTAWIVLALRGIFVAFILFMIAPFFSSFFNVPELLPIIRLLSICQILKGAKNIGIVYFDKDLNFRKRFFAQIFGILTNFFVTIYLAFIFRSVWAIVFGMLASHIVDFFVSYLLHKYRPRLKFNLQFARELFNFGLWIFFANILVYLITQGDDLFVGKFLGVSSLGFYMVAYRLSNLPVTEIAHVISSITFPLYSKLQNNKKDLEKTYFSILRLIGFMVIPFSFILFVLSPVLIKFILTDKWGYLLWPIRIFCAYAIMRSIQNSFGSLFMSIGKPRLITKVALVNLLLMVILIYPLSIRWNIKGAAIAVTLSMLVSILYGMNLVCKIFKCQYRFFYDSLFRSILASCIVSLSILFLRHFFIINLSSLLISLTFGFLLYIFLISKIDMALWKKINSILVIFLNKK